jgi:hypothetical protein
MMIFDEYFEDERAMYLYTLQVESFMLQWYTAKEQVASMAIPQTGPFQIGKSREPKGLSE